MLRFLRKLEILLGRHRFRGELDEEMAFHREQAEKELIARGMTREDARSAAARQFGNAAQARERVHDVVDLRLEYVWQDLRYALRQLSRSPGFTAAVIGTLMLGIGATTAIFTLIDSTLLRKLPYPGADRIVRLEDVRMQGASTASLMAVPRFFDLQARNRSFESAGFFFFENATLISGANMPIAVRRAGTNAGFWHVYGGRPLLGRTIEERDDLPDAPQVAVLSYKGWQLIFHGDPGVVGRHVTIEQNSTTIIGVMPREFNVPNGIDLWRAAQIDPAKWTLRNEGTRFINGFALLRPGVSEASAQSDLDRIGKQLQHEHPETDGMWQFGLRPLRDDMYGELRPALMILWIASGFLLLMACVNVANLLLTRAAAREREVALRRALGASEGRIRLQFFTESSLLALLGGAAGLGLAYVLIRLAASKLPGRLGAPGAVTMNWPVVWFAFGVAIAAAIAFGLIPGLRGRTGALNSALKQGDHQAGGVAHRSWARGAFISVQVSLSLVLLVGASLLAESLWNLIKSPLGFTPDRLLTFEINLPWFMGQSAISSFFLNTQQRIESLPGVTAAGQIDALPTVDWHLRSNFDADWLPRVANRPPINAEDRHIAGNYLAAMGSPLLAGRAFTAQDQKLGSKTIMVNRELVREFLPRGDVIGRHLIVGNESFQIVGVLADVRGTAGSISKAPGPEVYWPADADEGVTQRYFVVRSQVAPNELVNSIREQIHQVDPMQAISNVAAMDDLLDQSVAQPRLNMALIAAFAFLALLLACVGIYGLVAWSVAQRVQEIGVRMALGATRAQIAELFVARTVLPTTIGIASGVSAALLLTQLLRSQLYGVSPANPWVYAISVLLLLFPVLIATLRPALRAASINPVDALRTE
jgi:predicted permease